MRLQPALSRRICLLQLSLVLLVNPTATPQTPHPAFDVAVIRPSPPDADPKSGKWSIPGKGGFAATHVPLALLIQLAWDIDDSQITHKPGWLDSKFFDLTAKSDDGVQLTREELRPRLQSLLQERLHLVVHREIQLTRGYALVAGKGGPGNSGPGNGGPHLIPTKGDHFPGFRISVSVSRGQMRGANWTMPQLAKYLIPAAHFPVIDETGIAGSYDIAFSYDPGAADADPAATSLSDVPSLNEALRQATGLSLEPRKVPFEFIVIDSADSVPTEN